MQERPRRPLLAATFTFLLWAAHGDAQAPSGNAGPPATVDEFQALLGAAARAGQGVAAAQTQTTQVETEARAHLRRKAQHDAAAISCPPAAPAACAQYNQEAARIDQESARLRTLLLARRGELASARSRFSVAMARFRVASVLADLEPWRRRVVACADLPDPIQAAACLNREWERVPPLRRSGGGGGVPIEWAELQDNGLVGGMLWQIEGHVPVNASPEERARARQLILDAARAAGIADGAIDLDRYNFVLGLAAWPDWRDIARAAADQATHGGFTQRHREAYAELRGKQFRELGCHSNGAMICLAALEAGHTRAGEVVLYGPQVTPGSLEAWGRLLQPDHPNRITSLRIVLNANDPVPGVAMLFTPSSLESRGATIENGSLIFNVDRLADRLRTAIPAATVTRYACDGDFVLSCHDMERYSANERHCRTRPGATVPGTRGTTRRGVTEPPNPAC